MGNKRKVFAVTDRISATIGRATDSLVEATQQTGVALKRALARARTRRAAAAKKRKAMKLQERTAAKRRQELVKSFPTSSRNSIRGYRILRQLRLIVADGHSNSGSAEEDFREQVVDVGGNGAINVRTQRHRGGFISISGDAVILE